MRHLLCAALLLLPALARAGDFGKLAIEKGYEGPLVVDVTWADGTTRDVTEAAGTITVYSTPPVGGVGGTVLFEKTLAPAGVEAPARLQCTLTAADTARPGSYYAEIVVVDGANRDPAHGTVAVVGR